MLTIVKKVVLFLFYKKNNRTFAATEGVMWHLYGRMSQHTINI